MSTRQRIFQFWLLMCILVVSACTNDLAELNTEDNTSENKSMPMRFNGSLLQFDASGSTRAGDSQWEWKDGDIIYLQYHVGDNLVRGYAVYTKATDSWEAFYSGTLSDAGECEVYFFEGASTSDKKFVTLTGAEPIYADTQASFVMENNVITLSAYLSPLTSRVQFTGAKDTQIKVSGIKYYSSYNAETNTFQTSTDALSRKVGEDGYTPYIYGMFADTDKRELTVINSIDGDNYTFIRSFPATVLRVGESGFLAIPTSDTNKGWTEKIDKKEVLTYTFSGNGKTVSFNMKLVEAGTFQMGTTNGDSDEKPVHSVTISKDYYMGETEMTQALWYAVMGLSPTSDGKTWSTSYGVGDDYPAYYISYNDVETFLTKLNTTLASQLPLGKKFRLPTEAEWEFAAKGGNKSNGYTYAGSNTLDDVAWYKYNSGSTSHAVGTKAANELGLYDMCGNVWEWCYDWFGSYSSSAQTDPTGPTSGSTRVDRGGSWYNGTDCRSADRGNARPTDRFYEVGFRLAL